MTPLYDLMLLLDASAPEDRRQEIVGEVEALLNTGGSIVGAHDWGSRKMSFEIDHRPEAAYHLYQFEGDNDLLERLNQRLRITDGILRFRVIRQRPGAPPPPTVTEAPQPVSEDEPDGRVAARAAADAPADAGEA